MPPRRELPPREQALRFLARREYCRDELKTRLLRRGVGKDELDRVLDELEADGQLSDRRFLENYVFERLRKLYGPGRIRIELLQKGFDEAEVREVLAQAAPDWLDNARRSCRKRFGEQPPADAGEYARRRDYLYRRGYPTDLIREILEK